MGMCICNDRRFPETFRVLGLRGAELVMLGFNTPLDVPWIKNPLTEFHSQLCMQAGAYQNGYYVVGVGKTGARGHRLSDRRHLDRLTERRDHRRVRGPQRRCACRRHP